MWQAFFGNTAAARQRAKVALGLSRGRDVEYAAAVALAMSGDASQSQALADDLGRWFPEDTSVQFNYLPALRGLGALNHNQPAKAIEVLQTAASHEFAETGSTFFAFFGMFYPVYFRGEAYLAAHQGAEATRQFQTILNHRGLAFNVPSALSLACSWPGPTKCLETKPKRKQHMRIFSRFGKMRTQM